MRAFGILSTLLLATSLTGNVFAAGPTLTCGAPSKCPAGVLDDVRAAAGAACPCDVAASAKAYAKCWKPVVRSFADSLGKTGFPKACRKEVARVLGSTTCGRSGFVLCRKKGGSACAIAKAKKCKDVFPTGRAFRSCADACDGLAALPFPSTTELATTDLGALVPDPDGTLTFDPAPSALDDVAVGKVIVAGVSPSTPAGLLRAVLAVERNGSQLVLRTGQAPIQLAYSKLHVRGSGSTPVTSAGGSTSATSFRPQIDFGTKKEFDYVLFDGDGDEESKNDQIKVVGEIGGGFDYDFGLDVDWVGVTELPDIVSDCLASFADVLVGDPPQCDIDQLIPEAKVTFVVFPQVNADANVEGAALLEYKKEVELASETLAPIIIGPLVFVPKADLTAELSGGASGQFSTGLHGSAVFETSVTVSSKQTQTPQLKEPELISSDFGPNETKVTLQAFARVEVGATLNLLLFGVTGPYATAKPYGAIEANLFEDPCWNLHAGLEATLGVKVTSPALPLIGAVTLVDWKAPDLNAIDLPISEGMCDPPPESSILPPGAGPDAVHLAMPTYTPWSRSWDSPVDGSNAASPGNGINFSDLQRTIDGRYVRSGYGVETLTKFDDAGGLTWARDLELDGVPLEPLRVRSARDATLFVAAGQSGIAPIVLAKVAQDGSAVEARAWDVPFDVCNVEVTALTVDDAGDAWIAGGCGDTRSFVLHATSSGSTFRLLGDIAGLRINVIEMIGDDVFLAGSVTEDGDALVAFRLGADGSVVYAKRYDGCVQAPDAIPSAAIVGSQDEVTIAGSGGAQHNGLILRVLADGSVGFASFPGFGFGAGSVFLLDSIVELPTTGYVAGGSVVNLTGNELTSVPSAALVGLDAVGNILWQKRYTFGTTGAYSNSGHVAVRLADDGGVVTTALLADASDPFTGGRLWAFKPFAKDGAIDFAPDAVTTTSLGITNLACSMSDSDLSVTVTSVAVPSRAASLTSTPVGLTTEQQTDD
ncbi:MAG TPA: hypothetical protein VGR62_16120 [Candidatus Binatia bacterium]|jgi:hypothetical protein|nr:hypothetical protein [Candidatus Binatia bacterium]